MPAAQPVRLQQAWMPLCTQMAALEAINKQRGHNAHAATPSAAAAAAAALQFARRERSRAAAKLIDDGASHLEIPPLEQQPSPRRRRDLRVAVMGATSSTAAGVEPGSAQLKLLGLGDPVLELHLTADAASLARAGVAPGSEAKARARAARLRCSGVRVASRSPESCVRQCGSNRALIALTRHAHARLCEGGDRSGRRRAGPRRQRSFRRLATRAIAHCRCALRVSPCARARRKPQLPD